MVAPDFVSVILAVGFLDVQQRSCAEVALGVKLEQNFLVLF